MRLHRGVADGQDGDVGLLGDAAGGHLVAELSEDFGARTDEGDAGFLTGAGERGVLRQKAVAGVDGVDVVLLGQRDEGGDVEVGADRFTGPADEVRLVGLEAVQGEAVLVGVDGDGANAEFVGGAKDADGDLAAVGGEQLVHGYLFSAARSGLEYPSECRRLRHCNAASGKTGCWHSPFAIASST